METLHGEGSTIFLGTLSSKSRIEGSELVPLFEKSRVVDIISFLLSHISRSTSDVEFLPRYVKDVSTSRSQVTTTVLCCKED